MSNDQLDNLNVNKPGGPDEMSPKLIKTLGYHLVKPLTLLFNNSLHLRQVPCQWKMASWKQLRVKLTPSTHHLYSKKGG